MEVFFIGQGLIKSIYFDQDELLEAIITLHLDGGSFDCDPTFSKGVFYRKTPEPEWRFDLVPQADGVFQADAGKLPLPNDSLESIMFDPPFLAKADKEAKSRIGLVTIPPWKRCGSFILTR